MKHTVDIRGLKVSLPNVPNFIRFGKSPVPIQLLNEADLKKIAIAWKQQLLSNARAKK